MQYPYNNKNWKFLHKQSRLKQFNRILAYLSDSYQFIQHVRMAKLNAYFGS